LPRLSRSRSASALGQAGAPPKREAAAAWTVGQWPAPNAAPSSPRRAEFVLDHADGRAPAIPNGRSCQLPTVAAGPRCAASRPGDRKLHVEACRQRTPGTREDSALDKSTVRPSPLSSKRRRRISFQRTSNSSNSACRDAGLPRSCQIPEWCHPSRLRRASWPISVHRQSSSTLCGHAKLP